MFRPASSSVLRAAQSSLAPARTIVSRRFISTAPPHLKSRSWKSSAARWGIAIAGLYYYNTSPVFAEQPSNNLLNPNVDSLQEDNDHSTLENLTSHRQKQKQINTSILETALETTSEQNASQTSIPISTDQQDPTATSSPADLEEEAAGQGAFNEETGEINWDCPCLGGMAHGPCGPEFREAFSCFVFSKEEPKGMDCIEKFKGMQDCFQQHPEIYKGELEDDEEIDDETKAQLQRDIAERSNAAESKETQGGLGEAAQRKVSGDSSPSLEKPSISSSSLSTSEKPQAETKVQASSEPHPGMSEEHEINQGQESSIMRKPNPPNVNPKKFDEDLDLMPKAWHDAREPEASDEKTEH